MEAQGYTKSWCQKYGRALKVLIPIRCTKKNRNNEVLRSTSVGLFSFISLTWLDKMLWRASRKGVQKEELKQMEDVDEVGKNYKRFAHFWNKEVNSHGTGKASLFRVVWRFCRVRLILAAFMMSLTCILQYVGPAWIMKYFLDFMNDEKQPMSNGITLAVLFSASQLLRSATFSVFMTLGAHTGIRTQGAIQMLIYEKILRLKQGNDKLMAEAINYFTTDIERIFTMLLQCMLIVGVPVVGTLNIFYCYLIMGPWSLLANGIVLIYFPVMGLVARKISEFRVKVTKVSDERINLTTQIISNIKLIKMYNWEDSFSSKIKDIRCSEESFLLKTSFLQGTSLTLPIIVILLAPMASFIGYVLCGGNLTSSMAFSMMTVFAALQIALNTLPLGVKAISEGLVSCRRIQETLLKDDVVLPVNKKDIGQDNAVVIEADLSWEFRSPNEKLETMKPAQSISVKNVNLHIKKGKLIGICGNIGSGKSTLLAGITGEAIVAKGTVYVVGSVALATQQPWIFNATIKDNILFGMQFDGKRYKMVVDACCLETDLKSMPCGDQTEIGENGANLSGGQKQRLNLARALYSNRDVYLLDDTLSAVDVKVGKHIFQNCIKKALCGKTVLMVTHSMQILEQCDYILVMKEGEISEQGTHDELIELNGDYWQMFLTDEKQRGTKDKYTMSDSNQTIPEKNNERVESVVTDGKMIKEEVDNANSVTWQTWSYFAKCCGGYLISSLPFWGLILFCAANISNVVWLQIWLDAGGGEHEYNFTTNGTNKTPNHIRNISQNPELHMYVSVYGICGIALIISGIIKSFALVKVFFKGSSRLHSNMFSKVTRSPMSFFDRTPLGRTIGRFSRDMDEIEGRIPFMAEFVLQTLLLILFRSVLICVINPYFVIIVGTSFVIYVIINVYLNGAVGEMKRIENLLRPPILTHITTTIQGLPVIRCYERRHMFIEKFQVLVNKHLSVYLLFNLSSNWFGFRVDALSWFTMTATTIIVLLAKGSMSYSMAGLSLSQIFQMCSILSVISRWKTELSSRLISIARVSDYCKNLLEEAPVIVKEHRPTKEWPSKGAITFNNVKLQYDSKLPLVLQELSVDIRGGEKVGIIGRTGAGKSSVIGALMRLTEISDGSIVIDGVDISKIGLQDLRTKIAVIPQEPFLFQGSVRWNLDPFERCSDEELWEALDKAHLKKKIMREPKQLESSLNTDGGNFSVGEKQLFCLARALLKNNKILLLDEATASVDVETDKLTQETLRRSFTNCTVLTIAHRLNTIADYDKIMTMENGKVIEFDSPEQLLQRDSLFRSMMNSFADTDDIKMPLRND